MYKKIIEDLIKAVGNSDSIKINSFYSDDCIIEDPIWDILEGKRARYWIQYNAEITSDHKLEVIYISEIADSVKAEWKSNYILNLNKKNLSLNYIANYTFKDNKIIKLVLDYDVKEFHIQMLGSSMINSMTIGMIKKISLIQTRRLLDNYISNTDLLT